jgi:hypothetical protein
MLPSLMYRGSNEPLPEQRALRAGPLTLYFENGDLRYIRLGQQEIIRRIYVAVRDRNWGTVPNLVSNIEHHIRPDSFSFRYRVNNQRDDIDFVWEATITGDETGQITFAFEGEARSTFLRNRIGFCILHPIRECAGTVCQIEHSDGATEETIFPKLVAPQLHRNGRPMPHGAFHSMRSMRYPVSPELWAEVRFEGDLFEMEDQRNWLDASFKTYCTPLQQPFPVEIPKGTRIAQQVRLTLAGAIPPLESPTMSSGAIRLHIREDAAPAPLPAIAVRLASQPLSATDIERLRDLRLACIQAEVDLSKADFEQQVVAAEAAARALDIPLSMALTVSDAAAEEFTRLVALLEQQKLKIISWLIFHRDELVTSAHWMELARKYLAERYPSATIGGGSKANFAELNRAWPAPGSLDFVSFTANPQVHAFDTQSIAETCPTFTDLIETANQRTSGKPVVISALTLRPRFNPVATALETPPAPDELPPQVDPRQLSLFGAGWTLGCLKYVCESGKVSQISCYETTGWLGVLEQEQGSPLPAKFPSMPGSVFPLYHVLADIGEMRGGVALRVESSDPLLVDALLLQKGSHQRLLIANLDSAEHQLQVASPNIGKVRFLDETTYETASGSPEIFRTGGSAVYSGMGGTVALRLLPYAVACFDWDVTV